MRRVLGDVVLSACALGVLLVLLMAFDSQVRDQVRSRFEAPARASADVLAAGAQASTLATVLIESVKSQSSQHGPLMVMVVAGTVLTLFMLRT